MEAEINLLDLAADPAGHGPPHALGRRLPAMIALLLKAAGITARHASATVRLDDGRTVWAVPAGLLDEGKAIELSHRMGPARFLVYGGLGPPRKRGGELPLTLRVLSRDTAAEVLQLDRDFYEEEVAHIALEAALALAGLLGKTDALNAVDPETALGTGDAEALLALHDGIDGLAAAEGGVSGSDASRAVELLLTALERDTACKAAIDHALSALSAHSEGALAIDRAVELATRLVTLAGHEERAVILLARLHLRRDDPTTAREVLTTALGKGSKDVSLAAELARVAASMGEYDEAIEVCQTALNGSEATPLDARLEASLREQHGVASAKKGRLRQARLQLERAVELEPDRSTAWANLARCHHLLGDMGAAVAAYDRSLELDGRAWEVARNYAELLVARGDLDRAESLLRVWAAERPDDLLPVLAVAELIAARAGRETEARAVLEDAATRHPEDPRIHALLGGIATQLELFEEAEGHYRRALELAPDDPALMSNLAVVLSHLGRHSDAEALARRAVELDPGDLISLKVLTYIRSKN